MQRVEKGEIIMNTDQMEGYSKFKHQNEEEKNYFNTEDEITKK